MSIVMFLALPLIRKVLVFVCWAVCLQAPLLYATEIHLNSGAKNPFATGDSSGFYDKLVPVLFERMGIRGSVSWLPSERALLNANSGIDDGNIARVAGIEKKYPNLIRVPEQIVDFTFMGYSHRKDIKLTDWNSVKQFRVGIIRGWKIYEKNLAGSKELLMARSPEQLFSLLKHKRVDLVMYDRWQAQYWMKKLAYSVPALDNPITSKNMFIYMHKKHAKLVPFIAATLRAMKKDGTYQRILNDTLGELQK